MDNKKKTLIISSIIILLLVLVVGGAYAFFTYENGTKSDIVTGQIYMNYEETSTISLTGVFPETKAQALARQDENGVFEFTITGRNTSKYPVYYEIDLLDGGVITGKTEQSTKIAPEDVRIYLERDGEILIDGKKYNDWDNRRVFVETVPANQTTNLEHNYTLRMWIDENVTISDTNPNADYTTTEWNTAYASLQVRVVGDFEEKTLPGTMARLGTAKSKFWADDIENVKANISEVNFIRLDNSEIDTRYNAATIKSDVTTNGEYPVKTWLEVNETNSTKYTMYVASEEEICLPSNSSWMFYNFTNLITTNFDNVDATQATNISYMFAYCSKLVNLDLSNFDTMRVTNMSYMFNTCSSLESVDLTNFDTSDVTAMNHLFKGCSSLIDLDDVKGFKNLDTSSVWDMSYMFDGCSALTNLDLSNFDTSEVQYTDGMFKDCVNLTSLDLSNFNTSKLYSVRMMFSGCTQLGVLDISNFTFDAMSTVAMLRQNMFKSVGSNLSTGTYTTVYVKDDYELDGTTHSPQNWILNLTGTNRPSGWSTNNVIVK